MIASVEPPQPIPQWAADMGLMHAPDERMRLYLPDGTVHWESNAGPQTWLQFCPCDEICYGGRRGGGKTVGLIAWMISGDKTLAKDDPARDSFLNDPDFRGLFLREQYQDLRDFVDEAVEFYQPFSVKASGNPVVLTFPSGAKIYTDHLGSEDAYNKYRGWSITRIGIEELTRIPKLNQYIKLFGSLRSKTRIRNGKVYPKLHPQIASTTNPDGPGAGWVTTRFVDVMAGGQLAPWGSVLKDPVTHLTKIFIPAALKDNPYLANDQQYLGMLMAQDPVTRAQWLDGDWHASGGAYFRDYRPFGPQGEEEATKFPWARHLIDSVELKPWWFRWGSGDWGYDHPAAFHKFCRNDHDGRIHVYDELMLRRVGSFDMGVTLAKWWAPELDEAPDHSVTIWLSPDAFSKIDEPRTRAEQIEAGIKSVLGPYGAFLLHYNDEERALAARDEKAASIAFEIRRKSQAGRVCILVRKANTHDRLGRFAYVRDLLRWRPLITETKPDPAYLAAIYERSGLAAYEAELAKHANRKPEVLPMVQIWRVCREADRCLREMVHDEGAKHEEPRKVDAEDGVGGDDAIDSCFVAGTMVQTAHGEKPIENISAGDFVWTRDGLKPVLVAGKTSQKALVYTVQFSDGRTLTGTAGHPVWVNVDLNNNGFVRLDSLQYGNIAYRWQSRRSFLTVSSSGATQTQSIGTCGFTTLQVETIGSEALAHSIKRFGELLMGKFPKVAISTTRMAMLLITTCPTLCAKRLRSIFLIMGSLMRTGSICGGFGRLDWKRPLLGTLLNRALNGIAEMQNKHMLRENALKCGVNNVTNYSQPNIMGCQGSALLLAANGGAVSQGWTLLSSHVLSVASNLSLIKQITKHVVQSTVALCVDGANLRLLKIRLGHVLFAAKNFILNGLSKDIAPVHVVRVLPTGTAPVYNLTVAESPEYFANGILVHNCSMGLFSWKDIQANIPKSQWVSQRMSEIQLKVPEAISDINRMMQIQRQQEVLYTRAHRPRGGTITLPRHGAQHRHR